MSVEIEKKALKTFMRAPKAFDKDGCLIYFGMLDDKGYGRVSVRDENRRHLTRFAHRIAFEQEFGKIPDRSLAVCHRCDKPACVNPKHLFLGTKIENWDDMRSKNRQARGNRHPHAKLTEDDAAEIKWLVQNTEMSQHEIGRRYGISKSAVGAIKRGSNWGYIVAKEPQTGVSSTATDSPLGLMPIVEVSKEELQKLYPTPGADAPDDERPKK